MKHNKVECDTLLLLFVSPENSTKALHFMLDLISVIDIWNDLLLVNVVQQQKTECCVTLQIHLFVSFHR